MVSFGSVVCQHSPDIQPSSPPPFLERSRLGAVALVVRHGLQLAGVEWMSCAAKERSRVENRKLDRLDRTTTALVKEGSRTDLSKRPSNG